MAFGEVGEDGLTSEPVKVWDTRTGEEMFFLRGHTNDVLNAMYSPDGRRIVTGGYDNTAKVWDAETGANLVTLRGHSYEVRVEGFSPNGRQIATVSRDGTVRIWTAKDWREQL